MAMKFIYLAIIFMVASLFSLEIKGSPVQPEKMKIHFGSESNSGFWRVVNDGVMGGRSIGRLNMHEDHVVFSGRISLDNYGGFSSVFRTIPVLADDTERVVIDVIGDGQLYQIRFAALIQGYRVLYKKEFQTTKGVREKIEFSFDEFVASFRGRVIRGAPALSAAMITEIGFLITKKVEGKFTLNIYGAEFYRDTELLLI